MTEAYTDIINLPGPIHDELFLRRHPPMSRQQRAKIFAPFAALVGFDERVRAKEIQYERKAELGPDEEWALSQKLAKLHNLTANSRLARENNIHVRVEYFKICIDPESDAYMDKGQYVTTTGRVVRVDSVGQQLILEDRTISFSDLYRVEAA